jgi:hypothetical protein
MSTEESDYLKNHCLKNAAIIIYSPTRAVNHIMETEFKWNSKIITDLSKDELTELNNYMEQI